MAKMGRPIKDGILRGIELLTQPHPSSPSGQIYTVKEAAQEVGVPYISLYYHAKKLKQSQK